jgi:hypothetical protein
VGTGHGWQISGDGKAEAALRVVTPLLEAPVADRHNWTLARLIDEIEMREGGHDLEVASVQAAA